MITARGRKEGRTVEVETSYSDHFQGDDYSGTVVYSLRVSLGVWFIVLSCRTCGNVPRMTGAWNKMTRKINMEKGLIIRKRIFGFALLCCKAL